MSDVLLILAGLIGLVVGAEVLVRGGSAIAARLGVSPLLIGLTVVSIGTSLPELAVGVDAARLGAGPLAIGNIAGTNIVNLLLILGLSAAMIPLALGRQTVRLDLPVMVGSALLLLLLSLNGSLSRLDGFILLAVAIVYTAVVIRVELRSRAAARATASDPVGPDRPPAGDGPDADDGADAPSGSSAPLWRAVLQLVGGIAVVVFAADWLVKGSISVASDLGVSEAFIGLTIVAIGTSAPELVTTIVSTIRGDRDLAIGNLVGSSVYNVTLILGASALVMPLEVTDELIRIDLPLMAAVALLCVPVFLTGRRISRLEGIAFVLAYVVYLAVLIAFRA
ncbi:calcium/sodium antiporter [Millisia brevis]|uniref:calcium/sodium antiporter n=1 Tax=Millisia brevis TaxID=264148 RepID=UPI00082B292C|nr:calcium/sodium antiporter [Millisia brevis]